MTPDRVPGSTETDKKTLLEAFLNLGQIAQLCRRNLKQIIANQEEDLHFLKKIPEQADQIEDRLEVLAQLLFDFSQKPDDFTLIHGQITDEGMNVSAAEVVFRKKADARGPRLYFRERSGLAQRIYVAVLGPERLNPFGDKIAVPEISIWSSGFETKFNFFLLIEEKKFCFKNRAADTMGSKKVQLLVSFVENYTSRFLSR